MAFFVCKCLNVRIRSKSSLQNVDIHSYRLSTVEQRDAFFNEDIGWCSPTEANVEHMLSTLVLKRVIGDFTLHTCLVCDNATHAEPNESNNVLLINRNLTTTLESFEELLSSEKYSPVFKIVVPELNETDIKSNPDINPELLGGSLAPSQQAIGNLNQQLTRTLRSEMEAIEEAVRVFKNTKYAEFENFRVKAHNDHKALAKIVKKSSSVLDNTNGNTPTSEPKFPSLERRRLSSFERAKKPKHNGSKNAGNLRTQKDSLDSEGIFDLEDHIEDPTHNEFSEDGDSDSDSSGSNDEGIHVRTVRGRTDGRADSGCWPANLAKSLPMNVPKFMNQRRDVSVDGDADDHNQEEPADIAASIKALARSVHGDVFGELPRPRFSTQI